MNIIKGIVYGLFSFALASAAWAGGGLHDSSASYDREYPALSMQDTAPVIPGTESTPAEAEYVIVEAPQYVVVEEWYVIPLSEDISLGG